MGGQIIAAVQSGIQLICPVHRKRDDVAGTGGVAFGGGELLVCLAGVISPDSAVQREFRASFNSR
jgi:hypothetical protein